MNLLASALVIWRLYSQGLHRNYRYFLGYLAFSVARTLALFPFSPRDPIYHQIWTLTQPLIWLSYLLVVAELYALVLGHYRGIYSIGRWFFFGAVFLAVVISGLTVLPALTNEFALPDRPLQRIYYAFIERGVVTSLAIFLFLLLAFVAWFSVPLSSNLLKHCVFYSVYFFANNVIMLYWTAASGTSYVVTVSRLLVGFACLVCWVLFLSRRGEDRIASLHLGRNALAERKLLTQLEDLNATLLRTARK